MKLLSRRFMVGLLPALLLAAVFVGPEAAAIPISYDLLNHPDGGASPPPYGLRLDVGGVIHTFDFEGVDPSVAGVIDTTTGIFSISGRVLHNQGAGGTFAISATIQLDGAPFTPAQIAELNSTTPDINVTGHTVSLELTPLDGDPFGPLLWDGYPDPPNFHIADHYRGVDELSGFGWLAPDGAPQDHEDAQDWLFRLIPTDPQTPGMVPEPATLSLLGLGLAGFALRRRFTA